MLLGANAKHLAFAYDYLLGDFFKLNSPYFIKHAIGAPIQKTYCMVCRDFVAAFAAYDSIFFCILHYI